MRPSFSSLVAAKNGVLAVKLRGPRVGGSDVAVVSRCTAGLTTGDGGTLTLDTDGDPPGMWIHYVETRASYGIAEAGETWAASGPFSGCHIAIGTTAGRVYVAHLAQQSGSTANEDWLKRSLPDEVTWGRWKVPVPSDKFFCNSVVFVDWSKGSDPKNIGVVRVDLKTKNMGGFDSAPMEIFNVVQVVG